MRILAVMLTGALLLLSACSSDQRSPEGSAANSAPEPSAPASPEPAPPAAPEPSLPVSPEPEPSVGTPTAVECSGDNAAFQEYAWGDFIVLPFDEREKAADIKCERLPPIPIQELPNLEGANPSVHSWAKIFPSVQDALTGLPAGTFIPALSTIPKGYRFVAVIALVNPETDEVVEVQGWYALTSVDPTRSDPLTGTPDLMVYWGRRNAFPIVQIDNPPPIEKIYVANHKGLYIAFLLTEREHIERQLRDAIQWSTEDGTFWTVQGFLPFPELLALAEQIALGYAAVSAP